MVEAEFVPSVTSNRSSPSSSASSSKVLNRNFYREETGRTIGNSSMGNDVNGGQLEEENVVKTRGVTRIEVVKRKMTTMTLCIFAGSIFLTAFVQALDGFYELPLPTICNLFFQ